MRTSPHPMTRPPHASLAAAWEDPRSFEDVLAEQLQRAPWFGLSLLVHALVALLLLSITSAPRLQREALVLEQARIEEPEQIDEEPVEEPIPPEVERVIEPTLLEPEELTEDRSPDEPEKLSELDDRESDADSAFSEKGLNSIIGLGGDPGGSFSNRGNGGGGGGGGGMPAPAYRAIEDALAWLARHQDDDGKWSAAEFMAHCPADAPCSGPGNPVHDVGITGLALLAFLGNGNTLRGGKYRDNVKRGTIWLRHQQDDEGLFGAESGHGYIYDHAIASLAMIECYGLSESTTLRRNAQSAVHYIQRARNPYKVWRYYPQDGQNDTSVTGWMVFALKSAKEFGLDVDQDALRFALAWFDEVTDPSTGQAGYTKRGEASSRKAGMAERFPVERTEAMTAVGALCRIFLGQTPKEHPVLQTAADTMLRRPPCWNEADGSIDLYYWYYASYTMYQLGGQHWQKWRRSLHDALIPSQHKEGHLKGSWDPISVWGEEGGRVYATAIGALCLQVYYRYTRLLR